VGVLVAGSAETPPEAPPGGSESATDRPGEDAPAPISVDVAMRVVKVAGQVVDVTPKEFDLLVLFVQNPGRPFSREELLDRIWKNEYDVTDRTIDTHVQRLRKKLAAGADAIQTVWGVGYRFQP
jgi:DNA-binding response OmpR family regulator